MKTKYVCENSVCSLHISATACLMKTWQVYRPRCLFTKEFQSPSIDTCCVNYYCYSNFDRCKIELHTCHAQLYTRNIKINITQVSTAPRTLLLNYVHDLLKLTPIWSSFSRSMGNSPHALIRRLTLRINGKCVVLFDTQRQTKFLYLERAKLHTVIQNKQGASLLSLFIQS